MSRVKVTGVTGVSWKELGLELAAVCLWQLLSRSTSQTPQPITAVPWGSGRQTATRLQRPPTLRDLKSLWCKFPSWTEKDGEIYCPASSLHPPTRFHYGQMKNDSFKTILTLTIIKVYRRSHKAIKVSLLQSLFGYSIVRHCIIKN